MTTTLELRDYYANLLILQYVGKDRARATIQTAVTPIIMPQTSILSLMFSDDPTSGAFTLSYLEETTASILFSDPAATVQTKLRALTGLAAVTVTGTFAAGFTITMVGVTPPSEMLVIETSTLDVTPTITEIDLTLPLAVQNAFNLVGSDIAVGVQLDTLGKYAGVTRTGRGFTENITLDDADFYSFIQLAIIKNSAGSSLATIQELLYQFFAGEILVFDYQNMQMSYLIQTSVGSQDLIQLFVTEGLLPKPMAVQVALVIYAPDIRSFFGFRTYSLPAFNATPFNTYSDYQTDWPWLSYSNAVSA